MSRRQPGAFLALWNSISQPALQPEYETWHTFEHVPERVGLPGFIEARRYRSLEGSQTPPGYFTCYWLDTVDALNSPQYAEVFASPTPWSARMRTELRDFFRLPCTLGGTYGQSTASRLATLHLRGDSQAFAAVVSCELAQRVEAGLLVCAQWGSAVQTQAIPIDNRADVPGRGESEGEGEFVVMLQGLGSEQLREQARQLLHALQPAATATSPPAFFELLSQVRQDELAHPAMSSHGLPQRQAPRADLFQQFKTGDKP
ncbi:MAG: hypothetical protein JWR60_478 [Polaromonas sp.]|nr:hypothetical protein [Polaromonas sp.]